MLKSSSIERGSSEKLLLPDGYVIDSIILQNHLGKEIDITLIQQNLLITQSIYRNAVEIEISVVDANSYFSSMELIGQEKITFNFKKVENSKISKTQRFSKTFFTYEYPLYVRADEAKQVYKIKLVSESFMFNLCNYISKYYNDSIKNILKNIFTEYLNIKESDIVFSKGIDKKIAVVIPNLRPFEAISLLLRKYVDDNNSPIFVYETLEGKIYVKSYSEMLADKTYRKYNHSVLVGSNSSTFSPEEYETRKSFIKEISCEKGFSQFKRLNEGAFSSTVQSFDIFTRTFKKTDFSIDGKELSLNKTKKFSKDFKIQEKDFSQLNNCKVDFLPVNSGLFDKNRNLSNLNEDFSKYKNAYVSRMENLTFEISLNGDFELYPSKIIEIEVRNIQGELTSMKDEFISGKYLVVAVTHEIQKHHSTKIIVKRDSFSRELEVKEKNANP